MQGVCRKRGRGNIVKEVNGRRGNKGRLMLRECYGEECKRMSREVV